MSDTMPPHCCSAGLDGAGLARQGNFVRAGSSIQVWKKIGGVAALAVVAVMIRPASASAQAVNLDFPVAAASGYDQQLGVTVLSRPRPAYETPGIRADGFEIRPQLDQTFGYDSNPTGVSTGAQGSFLSHTAASVSAASLWSRNSLAATAGIAHHSYFGLPGADYTDWNVGLQGGYTLGESQLTAAYSHSDYHQLGTSIGMVQSDTPAADSTDTARLYYTLKLGRIDLTPDFSFGAYRYGDTTSGGVRLSEQFLDRNVFAGGVTARYSLNDVGGLIAVARTVDSVFLHGLAGAPSNDAKQYQILGGVDYQSAGLWRYQLLVGGELNTFSATQFSSRLAPIVEGNVTWSPTGVTTIFGSVSRSFEEPLAQGNNGFYLNQVSVRGDYELMRNVLLQARGGVQYAQYLGGGTQVSYNFGATANWLLNRNMRLSVGYDYVCQTAASGLAALGELNGINGTGLSQNVIGLTLHVGL